MACTASLLAGSAALLSPSPTHVVCAFLKLIINNAREPLPHLTHSSPPVSAWLHNFCASINQASSRFTYSRRGRSRGVSARATVARESSQFQFCMKSSSWLHNSNRYVQSTDPYIRAPTRVMHIDLNLEKDQKIIERGCQTSFYLNAPPQRIRHANTRKWQ